MRLYVAYSYIDKSGRNGFGWSVFNDQPLPVTVDDIKELHKVIDEAFEDKTSKCIILNWIALEE